MPTSQEFASNIVAQLALTEPTLDTSIGSITRKFIDAVAQVLAEQSLDNHLIHYAYDIDSKSGADLTDFVALFGFKRLAAGRATGVVVFKRSSRLANILTKIPLGTQVTTGGDPPLSFQTMMHATLAPGQLSVDVPVQAFTPGPTSNVAAGTVTKLASSVQGVESVTNPQPCTGGTNQEGDADLRTRFKATVFRNLAGTAHMYRAVALQTPADQNNTLSRAVSAANVVGPRLVWQEQVQIGDDGMANSTIPDAAYIYPASVALGANINGGDFMNRGTDQDYTTTINNTIDPDHPRATLRVNSVGDALSPTTPYDLRFDYVSIYSRNDPFGTRWDGNTRISNRVDVWVNGYVPQTFGPQNCKFSTASGLTFVYDDLHQGVMDPTRYRLSYPNMNYPNPDNPDVCGKMRPEDGDFFTPLLAGPVVSVPNTLVDIDAHNTYSEGTHYDLVHQSDAFGYGPTSRFGLVWHADANGLPPSGTKFSFKYVYNRIPGIVQQELQSQWRLLGTDAQIHAGIGKYYRFHLGVVYLPGHSRNTVNLQINNALNTLINSLGFRSAMQVSDILQAVHNVNGVDNVRFLTSDDDSDNFAIQRLYLDPLYDPNHILSGHADPVLTDPRFVIASTPDTGPRRARDVYFDDASYPIFDPTMAPVRIMVLARNTFGVS